MKRMTDGIVRRSFPFISSILRTCQGTLTIPRNLHLPTSPRPHRELPSSGDIRHSCCTSPSTSRPCSKCNLHNSEVIGFIHASTSMPSLLYHISDHNNPDYRCQRTHRLSLSVTVHLRLYANIQSRVSKDHMLKRQSQHFY